jgi:hypothetical protein
MLGKKSGPRSAGLLLVIYTLLWIGGCQSDRRQKIDVSAVPVEVRVERFESELFALDTARMQEGLDSLRFRYGSLFDLFAYRITRLGTPDPAETAARFREFVADTNFRRLDRDCQTAFPDLTVLDAGLTDAFRHYRHYLPEGTVPRVATLVSAFSYPIVCDSTWLGIALDMYLGSDYALYNTLQPPLPNYIRRRMRPEYIVPDAVKGWLLSDYGIDESSAKLVEMMVAQGRIHYALRYLLPEAPDSLLCGYTGAQLDWCRANEQQVWSFFVDQKLLFSNDPNILLKYAGEGPSTGGFPKESPGNIALYTGWRIVEAYMERHPDKQLQQLLKEQDLLGIFNDSGYKPRKP